MNLKCIYCEQELNLYGDESSLEGTLIKCSSCAEEWIFTTKTEISINKLEELEKELQVKEATLNEITKHHSEKIAKLEEEIITKKDEFEKQKILEEKISIYEKRITNAEKVSAEQAELEVKIKKMEDELSKTSNDIINKNKDIENKTNYLEMKIGSSIITNKDKIKEEILNEVVDFKSFDKNEKKKEDKEDTKVKKTSFWRV